MAGLGYVSSYDELDTITGTFLVNIEAEIKKQEKEEHDKAVKKGSKRGR